MSAKSGLEKLLAKAQRSGKFWSVVNAETGKSSTVTVTSS
jgi:hypothetical protein